ncbi:hypothetical protein EPUL_004695 [Erysiphe pulchra]|uniref:Retrotransposon gag domain-containing protein n=1 Tax=Erysiphe pulchra TaxID=225359 RepID=A0A2S4PJU2_9PEZI|nr:hypothetical protein EPUL_004695 [Erysiphe pulchra]
MGSERSIEMADYDRVGLFKGKQPASRWLARLAYERKRVGRKIIPEEFFEAVEILFEDDAANWLDSNVRYRRIIDNRESATMEDVDEFETAMRCEFPTKSPNIRDERTLQEDIGNFSQGPDETLYSYFSRAQKFLKRSYGRDVKVDGSPPLTPIEMVVLSGIISAFLGGLKDNKIRITVLMKSTAVSGSLRTAYEAAEDAREEKKEFELLKSHFTQERGRPLNAVLADIKRSGHQPFIQDTRRNWGPTEQKQPEPQWKTQENQNERTESFRNMGKFSSNNKPPKTLSRHPLINGTTNYNKEMGIIYIRRGERGHKKPECTGAALDWWEQLYLKEIGTNSNYPWFSHNGSGLRFRDIDDSSWRR